LVGRAVKGQIIHILIMKKTLFAILSVAAILIGAFFISSSTDTGYGTTDYTGYIIGGVLVLLGISYLLKLMFKK
jgi:Na+-translocating ferredoxin:NAD+ oxidoreductase RnfD subunit